MSTNEKHIPVVGEPLYIVSCCGTETPYTVEAVNEKKTRCVVREAGMYFRVPRYFDSLPDYIFDDLNGAKKTLFWSEKSRSWKEAKAGRYAGLAIFGRYSYQPYLD